MNSSPGRTILIVLVGLLVAAPLAWRYVGRAQVAKLSSWQGTIADQFTETHRSGRYSRYTTYHWRVTCDDGTTRTAEVSQALHGMGRIGERVYKLRGERWPHVERLETEGGHPHMDLLRKTSPDQFAPKPD